MSRRGLVAGSILLCWGAGLGMLARRELVRPRTERLAEAAMRISPGATFYAVYQGDRQIGFASSTIDTSSTTARAPSGLTVSDYLVADLPVASRHHRAEARTTVHLTRALRLTGFSLGVQSSAAPLRVAGTVSGDTLLTLAVKMGSEPADTQRVALAGPVLLPTLLPLAAVLGDEPKIGREARYPVFDPMAMAPKEVTLRIVAESLFVLPDSAGFDSTTRRWRVAHADTVRAWQVVEASGHGFRGWVDEQGRVVQATEQTSLVLKRLPYEMAFENWRMDLAAADSVTPERDILETTAIAARKLVGRRRIDRLRVVLGGSDLTGFDLAGGRQALRGDTLAIAREDSAALTPAYTLPADRQRFASELAAEPLLEVRSPAIVHTAARIAGAERDPRTVAAKLARWVHDSVRNEITVGVPSAIQVLATRRGDCNEHTQLYTALARALGLPTRIAAGLAWVDGKFYYHAWPEVWLGDWVAVDPTFGQFPADAAHLRFTIGGLARQAELLRLMGNLEIQVLN